jgi:hypothetical protein
MAALHSYRIALHIDLTVYGLAPGSVLEIRFHHDERYHLSLATSSLLSGKKA